MRLNDIIGTSCRRETEQVGGVAIGCWRDSPAHRPAVIGYAANTVLAAAALPFRMHSARF